MSEKLVLCERILLINDDGIDALGMKTLEQIAKQLAHEIWVVAPESDQSGTSHSINLHSPLRIIKKGEKRYAVNGSPGDCVAIAIAHLMRKKLPGLLLSGVNCGTNIGIETMYSGTIGAAMTGKLMGIPSMALSQEFLDRNNVPWETALKTAPKIIHTLYQKYHKKNICLNINFPAVHPDQLKPATLTRQGYGYLRGIKVSEHTDPRNLNYYWLSLERLSDTNEIGTEAAALKQGSISVTPLGFDRTHAF